MPVKPSFYGLMNNINDRARAFELIQITGSDSASSVRACARDPYLFVRKIISHLYTDAYLDFLFRYERYLEYLFQ